MEPGMLRVDDILKIKGEGLYTIDPEQTLVKAVDIMARENLGSLVVMEQAELAGLLTFREMLITLARTRGSLGIIRVRSTMDADPLTCTPQTELAEVRRMMVECHVRYMPVMDQKMLMGVVSFYDVAKTVLETQETENQLLRAYIRDWPPEEGEIASNDPC
jgi:CBS domain-containing protein